jgi:hypothetical protein
MFVALTILSIGLGIVGQQVWIVMERRIYCHWIQRAGGYCEMGLGIKPIPSIREYLGDEPCYRIILPPQVTPAEEQRVRALFAESWVNHVNL